MKFAPRYFFGNGTTYYLNVYKILEAMMNLINNRKMNTLHKLVALLAITAINFSCIEDDEFDTSKPTK
jgi:hypothetical protein